MFVVAVTTFLKCFDGLNWCVICCYTINDTIIRTIAKKEHTREANECKTRYSFVVRRKVFSNALSVKQLCKKRDITFVVSERVKELAFLDRPMDTFKGFGN